MAVRVAQWMTAPHKANGVERGGPGHIVTAQGDQDAAAWGKRADWCDYHADHRGKTYGIAIFDHPQNLRHPTWWMVRSYGLFAANPFGWKDFENLKDEPHKGDYTIPAGGSLTLRYRFFFHPGDEKTARVAKRYAEYVDVPGDWPQFHGPNRNSICTETGLLQEWPQGGRKLLWKCPRPNIARPENKLGAGYETGANLLKLTRAGDLIQAEEVYYLGRSKMGQSGFINCHGGVVLIGDYLYGAHGDHGPPGNPTCIEFMTGKIMWKEKPPTRPGSASVPYADNRMVWRHADGTVFLVEPSPQEFRIKGQYKAAVNVGDAWAHPVIHDGKLYLRSQDALMCYDVRAR